MEKNQAERRKFKRLNLRVKVELTRYDPTKGKTIPKSAFTCDVGGGGLLVEFDQPVEVGNFVLAKFTLPGEGEKFEFIARVVRIEEVEPLLKYELGLTFVDLEPGAIRVLDRFVTRELEKDPETQHRKEEKR